MIENSQIIGDPIISALMARIEDLEKTVTAIGYDAKASKKRRFPSKRQESVLKGLTRAMCVETIDPWKENRVRFFHPLLHNPNSVLQNLPFASPVSSMGGFDDCGLNWVPPAGSTIMVFFEGGSRDAPFYIGTTWHRNRGPGGQQVQEVFPSREWDAVYAGHRGGYLYGPNDESQVLPPWNTESYNSGDIDQIEQFSEDTQEQARTTYPNIYGFKTPEKHMWKGVDGNAKCNRYGKRLEILSGCGNWIILKDDHLHHGTMFANPKCGSQIAGSDISMCSENGDFFSDIQGQPIERDESCNGKTSSSNILGGHPSTPCDPKTKYCNSQKGSNKFFKHENECRPYIGPGTPQNNRCDLAQSGIQFLSIGGHTFVMDDSVEEPRGIPNWERSLEAFDTGCNDKIVGRMYLKSMTGHGIMMSDVEEDTGLRGKDNYIKIISASGNSIELNDHTIGEPNDECPPNYAGERRGIHLQSTSNHQINMVDEMNLQCSPTRREGGSPTPQATKAYIQIRSGYGSEMRFSDDNSQQITQNQWIQITNPQCFDQTSDDQCNACDSNDCRGPHFLRFQARPKGQPGIVFLRAGGHSIRQSYDMDLVIVGDKEKNPADKFTYVSRKFVTASEDVHFRYSGKQHVFFAENEILLMAGRDCPPKPGHKCKGACLYNVIVARCPVFCPLTGILHWTEQSMSERVFASANNPCQNGGCKDYAGNVVSTDCSSYAQQMSAAKGAPCSERDDSQQFDTGSGNPSQTGGQTVTVPTQTQPDNTVVDPNTSSTLK